jgi:4-amino-4-deoxy-L-arabinose transferase-like glycosyltransferase
MPFVPSSTSRSSYDGLWLLAGLLFLFSWFLGWRPFAVPDEGRYVEIAREMVRTGEWIIPHLNGLPYFEKPPLVYWILAGFYKLFGPSYFGMRLPIALFAIAGCLMTYWFVIYTTKRTREGLLVAFMLATSLLYLALGRIIILDMVFSVFIAGALYSFWILKDRPAHKGWALAYGGFLAAALLTKGLAGIVLPGAVILLWIFWERAWNDLKVAFHPWALLTFFVLAIPWHVAAALKNHHFLWFYFVHEHMLRYTTTIHRRFQPFWFFVPIVVGGFFPWSPFCWELLRKPPQETASDPSLKRFLGIWVVFIFLFYSLSSSKLIPYILPIFFPLAILVGQRIFALLRENKPPSTLSWGSYVVLALLIGAGLLGARFSGVLIEPQGFPTSWHLSVLVSLITFVLWTSAFWVYRTHKRPRSLFLGVGVNTLILICLVAVTDPFVQKVIPPQKVAHFIRTQTSPETVVAVIGRYPQDLPVYLDRTIKVVNWRGELEFGQSISPQKQVLLNQKQLQSLWQREKNVVILIPKDQEKMLSWLKNCFSASGSFHRLGLYTLIKKIS